MIQLNKQLQKEKWKSLIVGQIHDSILLDVVPKELNDLLLLINDIMVRRLRKAWPWIIVPLEVEAEVTDVDSSWYEKKKVRMPE